MTDSKVVDGMVLDGERWRPTRVDANLVEIPIAGSVQLIIRVTAEDKKATNRAAQILNMTQTDFLRMCVLNITRAIEASARAHQSKSFQGDASGDEASPSG